MNKSLGFLTLLASALIYGSFGIWIRLLSRELTIYQQIVLRNVAAFIITLLIIILTRRLIFDFRKTRKVGLIIYTLAVPLQVIFYNISMLETKIALGTFAYYSGTIIFSIIFGIIFFRERLNFVRVVSGLLALIGLFFFVNPISLLSSGLGVAAGFVSGIFDAVGNSCRKEFSGKVDKVFLILLTTLGGILISGLMLFGLRQDAAFIRHISLPILSVGLFFGFLLVVVNYLLLIGFQRFELGMGTVVLSLELFFASLFGLFIFQEIITAREMIGGGFILLAIILPSTRK